jgi:hypothetical protein
MKDSAEERAATAARLTWMLGLPVGTAANLAGPPSESKTKLSGEEIAAFKARVGKCWVAPPDVPRGPATITMRIALNLDGTLGAEPKLTQTDNWPDPRLIENARRALQKCQPYAGLPAEKYRDWRILDLNFTGDGPAGLSGPPGGKGSASR